MVLKVEKAAFFFFILPLCGCQVCLPMLLEKTSTHVWSRRRWKKQTKEALYSREISISNLWHIKSRILVRWCVCQNSTIFSILLRFCYDKTISCNRFLLTIVFSTYFEISRQNSFLALFSQHSWIYAKTYSLEAILGSSRKRRDVTLHRTKKRDFLLQSSITSREKKFLTSPVRSRAPFSSDSKSSRV